MNRIISFAFALLLGGVLCAAPINVPLGGNAYLTSYREGAKIVNDGVVEWGSPATTISTWFKINKPGKLNLSVRAKALSNNVRIFVSVQNKNYGVSLNSKEWSIVPIADDIVIDKSGYVLVSIRGVSKDGDFYADLSDLVIDGSSVEEPMNFVRDFSYYWGHRGPSVHMGYKMPENVDVEYFYNEVIVPEGEDVIGSYFMSNGFGEGYFGMQVNSANERRILFSVWSPFSTDNPKDIPADEQIKMLRRGKDVYIGEFGNEGSGGQSRLSYMWKPGVTYKFLSQVRPDGKGNTVYTAYFFAPEENQWRLIASFSRPKTNTWYKRPHSFLENFSPNQGFLERKGEYGNQWAVTSKGKWVELNVGTFTYDATAGAKVRMDYQGGIDEKTNRFYLKNGGFFNENTPLRSTFTRKKENKRPVINLKSLEKIK